MNQHSDRLGVFVKAVAFAADKHRKPRSTDSSLAMPNFADRGMEKRRRPPTRWVGRLNDH